MALSINLVPVPGAGGVVISGPPRSRQTTSSNGAPDSECRVCHSSSTLPAGPFKAPYLAALVASSCSTSASGVPSEGGRINADAADNGREVGCEAISVRYLDSSSHLTAWAILAGLPKASPRPFLAASASVQDHSARSDATVGAGGRSIITTGAPASRPRSNSTYTGIHWKEALAGTG